MKIITLGLTYFHKMLCRAEVHICKKVEQNASLTATATFTGVVVTPRKVEVLFSWYESNHLHSDADRATHKFEILP